MKSIEFKFELNKEYMTHLKHKSCYNHNYYELDLSRYGDYIIPEKCNILFKKQRMMFIRHIIHLDILMKTANFKQCGLGLTIGTAIYKAVIKWRT